MIMGVIQKIHVMSERDESMKRHIESEKMHSAQQRILFLFESYDSSLWGNSSSNTLGQRRRRASSS